MPRIRNNADRVKREAQVRRMIDDGLSQNDMAKKLGITPQAVQKFLRTRKWKTKEAVRLEREAKKAARAAAKKKAEAGDDDVVEAELAVISQRAG